MKSLDRMLRRIYKKDCTKTKRMLETEKIANEEMEKWGLRPPYWFFSFNSCKKSMGYCRYPHKGLPGLISLSKYFVELNDYSIVLDIIKHEIAHALAGLGAGHGDLWKEKCLLVGAIPKRCCEQGELPEGKWTAKCSSCLYTYHRHRKPKQLGRYWCPTCGKHKGYLEFKLRSGS